MRNLILRYHYSRRAPDSALVVTSLHEPGGLFGNKGPAVCGAMFCMPASRWKERVLELSRLVRRDDVKPPLSLLLSLSCSWIRKHTDYDLIITYADKTQGHTGTVYRASNWLFVTERKPTVDGMFINGKFVPGRTINQLYKTRSKHNLKQLYPTWTFEDHWDSGKIMYAKPLSPSGLAKLKRMVPSFDATQSSP